MTCRDFATAQLVGGHQVTYSKHALEYPVDVTVQCGSGGQWWDLETAPNKDYGEKELEAHRESVEREKKNYLQGQEDAAEYK